MGTFFSSIIQFQGRQFGESILGMSPEQPHVKCRETFIAEVTEKMFVMKADLEDEDSMDEYMEKLDEVLASTFDEPNDTPDEALDAILANDKFKRLSKLEYAAFKQWLDAAHPSWTTECGLVSEVNPATGRAEWVPPGTLARS